MHAKFEELYNDILVKVDELAERMLTLGYIPAHHFSFYLNEATIREAINVSNGKETKRNILESFQVILKLQHEIHVLSTDPNDEGTNALMSDYIREQEKLFWMYGAYLN